MTEFIVTLGEIKKQVNLTDEGKIIIDDKLHSYELKKINLYNYILKLDNRIFYLSASRRDSDNFAVYINGKVYDTVVRSALQEKAIKLLELSASGRIHKTDVKAPMPGMILKIKKNTGDFVQSGESVIILEAMKMENDLRSPASGIIKGINIKEGNAVEKGTLLFYIEQA